MVGGARKLGETDFYYCPDGTAHKNRMQGNDFPLNVMYRRGLRCFSCHDAHGYRQSLSITQVLKPANFMCLECRGPGSPNGPHTGTMRSSRITRWAVREAIASRATCRPPGHYRRRQGARSHVSIHYSRHDGPVQDSEPLYFVPPRQVHLLGYGGPSPLARAVAVAAGVGGLAATRPAGFCPSPLVPLVRVLVMIRYSLHSSRKLILSSTAANKILPWRRSTARPKAEPATESIWNWLTN